MEYGASTMSEEALASLTQLLAHEADGTPWRDSTTYDGVVERVSAQRSSQQKTLKDPRLFDVVDRELLPLLDGQTSFKGLRLVRNHTDYIRSVEGDGFKAHHDFELLAGPGVRSLVLLVCLQAPSAGGQLVLWPDTCDAKTIPYACGKIVLFACRTPHAACPVSSGEKRLLKFDVVASEDLWSLRVAAMTPGAGERVRLTLGKSILHQCDALMAKLDFAGRCGAMEDDDATATACSSTDTDLLNAEEVTLLLDFYLHRRPMPQEQLPDLYAVLDRLCCPEAHLSRTQLLGLHETGCALLTPQEQGGIVKLFAGRRIFRLVFVAAASRTSSFVMASQTREPAEDSPSECESAWCIGEAGAGSVFFSPSRGNRIFEVAKKESLDVDLRDDAIRFAFELVLEHEIARLEGSCLRKPRMGLESPEDRRELVGTATEPELDTAAARTEGDAKIAGLCVGEDYKFLSTQELIMCSVAVRRALRTAEPAKHLFSSFEEEDECNDGVTYSTVRYETTILRRGWLLVDTKRLEALTARSPPKTCLRARPV